MNDDLGNAAPPPLSREEARLLLPRTWNAFFARFGRLLPIQAEAIPPLYRGRNALLCAPTAAGKTEAAVAPMLERLLEAGAPRGGILYVAPTRALVNDMDRRLETGCRQLGLERSVRTGDRRELDAARPPHLLLTTPESLDSLLCRMPGVFANLRGVILDEIHQLDGNYRGDQVRVLLRRLAERSGRSFQVAALSATVAEPEATAVRYMDEPVVCRAGAPRRLELRVVPDLVEAVNLLREEKRLKVLLFCNRRADAEETAVMLGRLRLWPAGSLFVHHGSLSRTHREKTEKALQDREWGLCCATMTLELGIDIGDVNAVVLLGPPPTAASFQQRIGRACRRQETIFIVGVAQEEWEARLFHLYARMAEDCQVEPAGYFPDLSVVVQQVFSLLYASPGGIPPGVLSAMLDPLLEGRDDDFLDRVLDHLEGEGWLSRIARAVRASTALMDFGERGRVHSNIPDSGEFEVVDDSTGLTVTRAFLQVAVGSVVALAGRTWTVTAVNARRVRVRPTAGGETMTRFGARSQTGAFTHLLPSGGRREP